MQCTQLKTCLLKLHVSLGGGPWIFRSSPRQMPHLTSRTVDILSLRTPYVQVCCARCAHRARIRPQSQYVGGLKPHSRVITPNFPQESSVRRVLALMPIVSSSGVIRGSLKADQIFNAFLTPHHIAIQRHGSGDQPLHRRVAEWPIWGHNQPWGSARFQFTLPIQAEARG